MLKIVVIAVGLYLACGVVFGLVTSQADYLCSSPTGAEGVEYIGAVNDIPDVPWNCKPALGGLDRLRWVAITTPAWLPLLVNNDSQLD